MAEHESVSFRMSGSPKTMTLYCDVRAKLKPYFRKRSVPWSIAGDTVYHWLSVAEQSVNGWTGAQQPSRNGSKGTQDGDKLFLFLTGFSPYSIPLARADLAKTYQSVQSYKAFPLVDELGSNKFLHWVSFRHPYELSIAKDDVLLKNLYKDIDDINRARSIAPDDDCALNDLFNDKKNLRGQQYLAFMNWCKAPLILPGTTSELKRLTAVEKSAAAACGTNAYLQFKLAQQVMNNRGIVDY